MLSSAKHKDPIHSRQTPFSLTNKFARITWFFCWNVLGVVLPRNAFMIRRVMLRCFGASVGIGVRIYPGVRIWAPWNLRLSDFVAVGDSVDLYSMGIISVGARTTISQRVFLCSGTHDYMLRSMPLLVNPITIGADVWLCAESYVGPGVEVGDGVVVGARSVVTKSVSSWVVVAGNPCRVVKERKFRDEAV